MSEISLIQDINNKPAYDDIAMFMNESGRKLWKDINSFIQEKYNASPIIAYSKCSEKPGWNIKYQKSGRSICTLYPERECFVALVVVTLKLVPEIRSMASEFDKNIIELINSAKPFNGTLWLMIRGDGVGMVNSIKKLLELKLNK